MTLEQENAYLAEMSRLRDRLVHYDELLEACKEMLQWVTPIPGATVSIGAFQAMNMLEEVIAKAEGRKRRTLSQLIDAAQGG